MIAPLIALALLAAPDDAGVESDAGAALVLDAGALDVDAGIEIVDAGSGSGSGSGSEIADAGSVTAEVPPPVPALDFTAPTGFRVYGEWRTRAALDTSFDSVPGQSLPENVAEWRNHATLGAEATFGERAKVVAEVRARLRAVEQRSPAGERFWGFNGVGAKSTLEAYPGDAYLDLYEPFADLRFGWQDLPLGANAFGAPADVLNPQDLREGVFFADPSDVRIPVLAARARGETFGFGWTVAYVPFFVPDRYDVYGQDEALLQPGLGAAAPQLLPLTKLQEDRAQQPVIETDRPRDLPQYGDVAARVTRKLGPVTVGADYAWSREKLPEVVVDPELARFIREGPGANFSDPATSLSLSQRIGAGEQLVHGSFPRMQVGEIEGSALLGPVQVDADVGYSPRRLFVDQNLNPVQHPLATGVVTVADARGTDLTAGLTAVAIWVRDIPQGERVLIIDLPGAEQRAHQTFGGGVAGVVGYRFWQDRVEAEARGFLDLRQRSNAVGGRVTWNATDHAHLSLGYEGYAGPALSPFGYFRRNDAMYLELRLAL